MRRVREKYGKTTRDVAGAARELGIDWNGEAVSRIERGKRELRLGEFLRLPAVLTLTVNHVVLLGELLHSDVGIDGEWAIVLNARYLLAEPCWTDVRDHVRELLEHDRQAIQTARLPAEGVSLHDERERRLIESGVDLSNPTHVRTARSWITRRLKQELRDSEETGA